MDVSVCACVCVGESAYKCIGKSVCVCACGIWMLISDFSKHRTKLNWFGFLFSIQSETCTPKIMNVSLIHTAPSDGYLTAVVVTHTYFWAIFYSLVPQQRDPSQTICRELERQRVWVFQLYSLGSSAKARKFWIKSENARVTFVFCRICARVRLFRTHFDMENVGKCIKGIALTLAKFILFVVNLEWIW